MGADNWTICPRCAENAAAAYETEQGRVNAAYGKVPLKEYHDMLSIKIPVIRATFREDYCIGLNNGVFEVSYSGRCLECDLAYHFKHKKVVAGMKGEGT